MKHNRALVAVFLTASTLSLAADQPITNAQKTKFQNYYCTANEKVGFVWKKKVVRPGKDLIRELAAAEISKDMLGKIQKAAAATTSKPRFISTRVWDIKASDKNAHWQIASVELDGEESNQYGPFYSFCKIALAWAADSTEAPQVLYAPCIKSAQPRSDKNPESAPPALEPFDINDFNGDGKGDIVIKELGSHGGAFRLYSAEKAQWALLTSQCESSD